jgi:hypothetical protein
VKDWKGESSIGSPSALGTEIMAWARENRYIVFTNELDYGALLFATAAASPSVIQIRAEDIRPATNRIDNYKAISSRKFQISLARFTFFCALAALWRSLFFTGFYVSTMDQDHRSAAPDHAGFDATRWSLVLEAAHGRAEGGPEALARLCERYWPPLYAFARHRGFSPEDAQDLVQGFFELLGMKVSLRA